MSRYALIVCALGALALGGCRGKTVDEMSYTEIKQLSGQIAARCQAEGISPKSAEWDACTRQEVRREIATREHARERANSRVHINCTHFMYNTVCN